MVDFLSIGWWPVFNVADPAVVGGAMLLVVLSLFGFDYDTVGGAPNLAGPCWSAHWADPAETD